jgi:hypothetical protein
VQLRARRSLCQIMYASLTGNLHKTDVICSVNDIRFYFCRNFQSFDSKSAVSGNIYESNPYLNPTVPYSGDVYGGSGQEVRDYNAPGGEFEDEPPLLEGKIL